MTDNLLKRPKSDNSQNKNRYEKLGLTENPFPTTPFVNKENSDSRYNGSIYESKIRQTEYDQFIKNFVEVSQSDPNHIRLGYIIDTSYVGRGNGKSAFTLNLIDSINSEFCLDLSNEVNKCFGLYIVPQTGGRSKTFVSIVDLIFESIIQSGIIKYSLASMRLEELMTGDHAKKVMSALKGKDVIECLNDGKWFDELGIEIAPFSKEIFSKKEQLNRLSADFPFCRDRNVFWGSNVTNEKSFIKHYDALKKPLEKLKFVFNDLVLFFEASGFNGAYIVIDDFEKIPDFQSEKLRTEFAHEIRTNFFDGLVENAKSGFFNLILVLHAGVPRLLEKAWGVSGMVRRSPMQAEADSNHIINFGKLNLEHAKLLLSKYLNEFRIDGENHGVFPFNDEVVGLIGENSEFNASTILQHSHWLIEKAAEEGIKTIDETFFNKKFNQMDDLPEEDESSEDSIDLFDQSKKDE